MIYLSAYFLQPHIWLIIAVLLVLLELTDGTKIFYLPMGLSAMMLALWVYLVNARLIPSSWQSPDWYMLVLQWAVLSLIWAIILPRIAKRFGRKHDEADDINRY